jgi:hypothetical protein
MLCGPALWAARSRLIVRRRRLEHAARRADPKNGAGARAIGGTDSGRLPFGYGKAVCRLRLERISGSARPPRTAATRLPVGAAAGMEGLVRQVVLLTAGAEQVLLDGRR